MNMADSEIPPTPPPPSTQKPPEAGLLSLPPEIRQVIYEECVNDDTMCTFVSGSSVRRPRKWHCPIGQYLGLLGTCTRINQEATPMFDNHNQPMRKVRVLFDFVHKIGPARQAHVQVASLVCRPFHVGGNLFQELFGYGPSPWRKLQIIKNLCPKLSRIVVYVHEEDLVAFYWQNIVFTDDFYADRLSRSREDNILKTFERLLRVGDIKGIVPMVFKPLDVVCGPTLTSALNLILKRKWRFYPMLRTWWPPGIEHQVLGPTTS